MITKVR